MSTTPPPIAISFAGTGVSNKFHMLTIPGDDGKTPLTFTPLPDLGQGIYTTEPLNPANRIMENMSMESKWQQDPSRAVICRGNAMTNSAQFVIKFVMHIDSGPGTLQALAAQNLWNEAIFYAMQLRDLQGTVVPRHYGVVAAKTPWGGQMVCAILEYFDGLPWHCIQGKRWETLESQMLVADAVQTLHTFGVEHGQLCSGKQHHILYDYDTKRVNVVDFSRARLHHCFRPDVKLEPLFHTIPYGTLCGELRFVGNFLDFWNPKRANERLRDVPKKGEKVTNDQAEPLTKTVAAI
ncbi:hypothetical protein BDZ89DRAFT_1058104 [Hymenopellis radicata]|nr:hypothetical protein BDZ89DRAFT_1058104 [Hymenopellis radicata]